MRSPAGNSRSGPPRVLSGLQVGVNLVVAGMQFFCRLTFAPRRRCRRDIAVDGFLPVAHARKGVRWHVQRMRRIRRNFRITPRRHERPSRQRRHVVSMDNVVRQSRMLRLLLEQFLQNRARLQPPRVGLVRGIFEAAIANA